MDTGAILYEIEGIDKELVRLRKKVTELNKRKKDLEAQAINLLKESGETSIKYHGKTYSLEERSRHVRKNDKKKRHDALIVLQDEGFQCREAEEVYDKITGALKGPETTIYSLKK